MAAPSSGTCHRVEKGLPLRLIGDSGGLTASRLAAGMTADQNRRYGTLSGRSSPRRPPSPGAACAPRMSPSSSPGL
jgi:hypothetical protein